ncbi:PleD family two-component system response regulator [Halobacteriovorax sp. HLS]|uniref:response regulator n=1 Tax=Halobacteriovorax sp. HLS TaxID=2234000 RepID=UPI000FD765D5|nr:response regulator [Halobacteriovorax sp. HLS]
MIDKTISILLVEDTKSVSEQMINDLKLLGFSGEIRLCETIKDSKIALSRKMFDLIICDWNLPDGEGVELLKLLRENPKGKEIPYLMCTTVDEIGKILEAVQLGASEYLVKPWTQEELFSKIEFTWSKHH